MGEMVMSGGDDPKRRAHVLMITMPYLGHFTPFVQLIHRLSLYKNVSVTMVGYKPRLAELANAQSEGFFGDLDLRLVEEFKIIPYYAKDPIFPTRSALLVDSSRKEFASFSKKALEEKQATGTTPYTSVIADFCQWWTKDFADELGVPWYTYHSTPAWWLIAALEVDKFLSSPNTPRWNQLLVDIPGLELYRARDLTEFYESPDYYRMVADRSRKAAGVLLNMAEALDAPLKSLDIVREHMRAGAQGDKVTPVFPIGPLSQFPGFGLEYSNLELSDEAKTCLEWLDMQPSKSVLYVAFGSLGYLTPEASNEIARGIEASGVPFLWILKTPVDHTIAQILPEGFEERVRGRGVVYTGWAPQGRFLSHHAIGAFFSHCGWNSLQECIFAGLPIIAWPIGGDQPGNARMVVNVWKVGISLLDINTHATVEEVTQAVKLVMLEEEGKEMRKRMAVLTTMAAKSLAPDGDSFRSLQILLDQLVSST